MVLSMYSIRAPTPQCTKASHPIKTQQRRDKKFIEGWGEFNCIFSLLSKYEWDVISIIEFFFYGFAALRLCVIVGCAIYCKD